MYSTLTLLAFVTFTAFMRSLRALSAAVGFSGSDYVARLSVQQACPMCRDARLVVPARTLIAQGLMTRAGKLAPNVTLDQLVERGFVSHPPHRKPKR